MSETANSSVKFHHLGDIVFAQRVPDGITRDKLDPQVYTVSYSEMEGFFLTEMRHRFDLPYPVFGKARDKCHRVINTYHSLTDSMGVLFSGNKGSGKTVLMEMIANEMLDSGVPVVMINQPYAGENFMQFIDNLGEVVLVFDEFAKTYGPARMNGGVQSTKSNKDEQASQEKLLSLLDGTLSSRRMVLMSENNTYNISEFMLNRPGRIRYHFQYSKVEEDVVREMAVYHGMEEEHIDEVVQLSRRMRDFSIDMMEALITEYNIYGGPVVDLVDDLNIEVSTFKKVLMLDYIEFSDGTRMTELPKEAHRYKRIELADNENFNMGFHMKAPAGMEEFADFDNDIFIGANAEDQAYEDDASMVFHPQLNHIDRIVFHKQLIDDTYNKFNKLAF